MPASRSAATWPASRESQVASDGDAAAAVGTLGRIALQQVDLDLHPFHLEVEISREVAASLRALGGRLSDAVGRTHGKRLRDLVARVERGIGRVLEVEVRRLADERVAGGEGGAQVAERLAERRLHAHILLAR